MGQNKYLEELDCPDESWNNMEFYSRPISGLHMGVYSQYYKPSYMYAVNQRVRNFNEVKSPYTAYPPSCYALCDKESAYLPKQKRQIYNFTSADVDTVLYGYLHDENNTKTSLHSLSGAQSVQASSHKLHSPKDKASQIVISLSHPELPSSLTIAEMTVESLSHTGVFTKETVVKGTKFGPFNGSVIKPHELGRSLFTDGCWEVFNGGKLSHYINGSYNPQNWLKFINCARYKTEQNMSLIQSRLDLYYEVIRDITPGQELLVWYGDDYVKYMDIPLSLNEETYKEKEQILKRPADKTTGSYPCTRCGKIFSYEYYREKHLKYTRCVDMGDRKFPCPQCQRSFEKKERLRIHILHVHQKYRPHVCKMCGKRFSQSSSLNKHSRVHTGERPYSCPHCPKSFTASSILRTHLRQHNGERPFKCKFCGKAFASHAAHDSHVKRTHDDLKTCFCKVCGKSFSVEFELKFHLSIHSTEQLANVKENYEVDLNNNNIEEIMTYSDGSENSLEVEI